MWAILAPIIARHGIEFAYKLAALMKSNNEPTEEDWQALRSLAQKRFDDYLMESYRRINPTPGVTNNPNP